MYIPEFSSWLRSEGKDDKTIQTYEIALRQWVTWMHTTMEELELKDIQPIHIKEYQGYLRHTLGRSHATINKTVAALKTYFAYLGEQGLVTDNPMTRIKLQKVVATDRVKDTMKWLTRQEQDQLISYVELERNDFKRLRNLAVIEVMLYAGLRVSEVEDLKLTDVRNVDGGLAITIREGKHGKYNEVLLVQKYSRNLRKWLKTRSSLNKPFHKDSPYVFVSERSDHFSARGIQIMLEKYSELAHMDKVTPHRLRHSYCKNLANSGVSIEVIRQLARHESIETTSIYVDPSHLERRQALERM
jgi:site-specific recombinase XerD